MVQWYLQKQSRLLIGTLVKDAEEFLQHFHLVFSRAYIDALDIDANTDAAVPLADGVKNFRRFGVHHVPVKVGRAANQGDEMFFRRRWRFYA